MTQTACENKMSRGERFAAWAYEWVVTLVLSIALIFLMSAMFRGMIAIFGDKNLDHWSPEELAQLKALSEAAMKYILIAVAAALGVYFISKLVGIVLKDAYKSAIKAGKARAAVYQLLGMVVIAPSVLFDTLVEYGRKCAEKKAEQ